MAYLPPLGRALRQGDLLSNVRAFALQGFDAKGVPSGVIRTYTTCVVVTQDCDLEQDYGARFPGDGEAVAEDKLLFGILLCGVYEEQQVRAGTHRGAAKHFSSKEWKPVIKNQDPRYQYLGHVEVANSCFVADFKDYFMVPSDFLYGQLDSDDVGRVAEMDSPWKEHLLQRFAWYLMRVGLPLNFDELKTLGQTLVNSRDIRLAAAVKLQELGRLNGDQIQSLTGMDMPGFETATEEFLGAQAEGNIAEPAVADLEPEIGTAVGPAPKLDTE